MSNVHRRVDIERWKRTFSLQSLREGVPESRWPGGDFTFGPKSVASLELLRDEAGGGSSMGVGKPVDLLVWNLGEPPERACTKVGGLPYRPASAAWPTSREGAASVFVGQMCFADSRDILMDKKGRRAELPGDVLLIFAPDSSGIWDDDDEDESCVQYEWWPLGMSGLVERGGVPEQPWRGSVGGRITPCHAELHRTMDYPAFADDHRIMRHDDGVKLCVTEGGKIGGVPFYAGEEDPRPGMFLGAFGSMCADDGRHCLGNIGERSELSKADEDGLLMFGDMGSLYLFQDSAGLLKKRSVLRWAVKGY